MAWTHEKSGGFPAARKDGLLVEQVGGESVVYDLNTKDVHRLNPLAAAVFAHCDGQTPAAGLAPLAEESLGEPVSSDDVSAALTQLQENALLETPPLLVHDGLSRRSLMQKSALAGAAAFATPLITSIAAPTAAMALNGIPTGCTGCGKNSDCVSNHCCQQVAGKQCNQSCCVAGNNSCRLRTENGVNICSVPLAGCGAVVCPPGTSKCCT